MTVKKYLFYASQNYSFAILRPLQKVILARGDEVKWYLNGTDINRGYLIDSEQSLSSVDDVMAYKADATFVPGNVVPSFFPGLKVAIFHGFNVEKRSNTRGHFNIRGCFDLYCTQGPNTTETFRQLSKKLKYFSVKETGWPAIDPLYDKPQRLDTKLPTVLLCSTFSKHLSCAETIFEQVKVLSQEGKWRWIVQFHPKMNKETVEKYKAIQSKNLTFIETDNVIPLLQEADVMVCDTSSVMSMFLLLNKPVVTFKNSNPKPHLIDIDKVEDLNESIEKALTNPPALMEHIKHFIKQTHPYSDGLSSLRVLEAVDELLTGHNLPTKRKPLNLVRKFQARKNLNYWRFF